MLVVFFQRETNVSITLSDSELQMQSAASESGDPLKFGIPLEHIQDAIPSEQKSYLVRVSYCIELRHRLPSLPEDSPPARSRLEFQAKPERDRVLAWLRTRRAASGPVQPTGSSERRKSISSCAAKEVHVATTIKVGDFTVYVLKVVGEDGAEWQVNKRYNEFETLRKLLGGMEPAILDISFPEKSLIPFSSTNASTVAKRRGVRASTATPTCASADLVPRCVRSWSLGATRS